MTKEKNIDTTKQENQSQDQFAAERLTDEELENVAGGNGIQVQAFVKGYVPSAGKNREKAPLLPIGSEGHCH